jgi:ankyrin repeat protein
MTPILLATKYNNIQIVNLLYENGSNLYVTDNKMQNVLHYSIYNENENMIKFFISKDEKFYLRKEKNTLGLIPMDLEKAKYYMTWLYTIWDCVNGGMANLIAKYVTSGSYSVNQKRPGDNKTPLHLAVVGKKAEVVRLLMKLGADTQAKDGKGKTPIDYLSSKND